MKGGNWQTSIFLAAAALVGLVPSGLAADGEYPDRPVQVIVPFGAGGNSDTIARILQRAIADHELLPQPLVIQNVPGAGGTIGSRRALHADPDGYTLLFLHEGIITARYSGAASWSWRNFAPIAATGRNGGVIAVPETSPFQSLNEIMAATAEKPNTITFATNIGAPAHFWAMNLENEVPGSQFRYVQAGGGAARFHSLKGGHVEATAFSVAEFLSYREGGLRALAAFSETRDPALADVPTAREQGIDLVSSNLQCWWAPLGTSPEKLAVISDALKRAMETPEFRKFADQQQIEPLFLSGPEFEAELKARETVIAAIAPRAISGLPDVPRALGILAIIAGIGAFWFRPNRNQKTIQQGIARDQTLLIRRTIALVLATVFFAASLSLPGLTFFIPTLFFLIGTAGLLKLPAKPSWLEGLAFTCVAALIAFGLPWIFETAFGISMP